ncbi:hypothetical protein GPJ56_003794 [Histomonas meleagridis]|uniref:uncharacterized protein n=1 Tax=Histomonas meleagridis TaxID=135588 RepID=UPI003559CD12|nr:hypothetical protein GPJ56_003794 [Histomonas meleagridis]KAH0805252.1 hypothetical protein GO595_002197 [Histomonas meleagridis]
MSILFEESGSKKKTRPKKNLLSVKSGLSSKQSNEPVLIFGEDLFDSPSQKPKKHEEKTQIQRKEGIDDFISSHPNIRNYFIFSKITDISLDEVQVKRKVFSSAESHIKSLRNLFPKIDNSLLQYKTSNKNIKKLMRESKIPSNATLSQRKDFLKDYFMSLELNRVIIQHIQETKQIVEDLITLLDKFIKPNPGVEEVKIYIQDIEARIDIPNFKATNKKYRKINAIRKRTKHQKVTFPPIEVSEITAICRRLLVNDFFIEQGEAETLFYTLVESTNEINALHKGLEIVKKNANSIGKAILASTNHFIKNNNVSNDYTSIYFILYARLYFKNMYDGLFKNIISTTDVKTFTEKVVLLRQQSAIGFGLSQNFLPPKLKSVPLVLFPKDNPYTEAIAIFSTLPYYLCPLDFCNAAHNAFKKIQSIASQISFTEKSKETKKVIAKSDHLLCLDDLFDISLLVFLLSNPVPVYGLVNAFIPYIEGLEMMAELEFAFTNISAIIRHIEEIDLNTFLQSAKERMNESIEVDPLNILSK